MQSFLWTRLSTNWRKQSLHPMLVQLEEEKLSIAIYETDQLQLDWDRMKGNARAVLDRLDVTPFSQCIFNQFDFLSLGSSSSA